jgi:hypothetical protein
MLSRQCGRFQSTIDRQPSTMFEYSFTHKREKNIGLKPQNSGIPTVLYMFFVYEYPRLYL